jgi:hypothetical protein
MHLDNAMEWREESELDSHFCLRTYLFLLVCPLWYLPFSACRMHAIFWVSMKIH